MKHDGYIRGKHIDAHTLSIVYASSEAAPSSSE